MRSDGPILFITRYLGGKAQNVYCRGLAYCLKKPFLCSKILKGYKMSEISSKVKAIIVEKLGVEDAEVTNESSFTNDLGADSLDTVELIMEFEKEFNVSIPDEEAENIQTVGQAIEYLDKNIK